MNSTATVKSRSATTVTRFQPAPLWLEKRIREALVEPAEPVTLTQFDRTMKAIADGR